MLWTLLLLIVGLLLSLLFCARSRRPNEPPLDKGLIPWLGHALSFGKDAPRFLAQMKAKHGDIFTVRVAGCYVTILLDPNSFDAVLNDTICLDSTRNRSKIIHRVFDLHLPSVQPGAERRWMEKHFQGLSLSRLVTSMDAELQEILWSEQTGWGLTEWKPEGLYSLCYSFLFRAGYLTLFERKENAAAVYKEFRKFDELLAKLARGCVRSGERKEAYTSRQRLWELLSPKWLHGGASDLCWQQSYHSFLQQEGVDAEMQRKALLLQLWTTQCNAGPAAFWLLAFLLKHPEAMEAVQAEIRGLTLQEGSQQRPHIQRLETQRTPVFDSVLSETLRLTAAVMITREVVKDKALRMGNGETYHLRRGDKVSLFPLLSPQMDPHIHQDPQEFKYDRFLNEDLTMKDEFYKEGRRLKYFTMPWGAGSNICVGKDFAVTSIKKFVFLILTHLELKLCDPDAELPPFNRSRYGFGMLQPEGDLQIQYRLKRTLNKMSQSDLCEQ
ncbi:prostacyclin synthase isoform X1 [Synchiropus splendidus]|uniref:prostacyclin synthase isoform X1 n=1 Tax=Synchiropus splendidus TaxID=270530 RepID=UPI00237EDAC1|nr:prostacyclin synthase isoform X1 [Synchiropus splendidus]